MEQFQKLLSGNKILFYHQGGMFFNFEVENGQTLYMSSVLIPFDFHHLFPREWRQFYSKSRHAVEAGIPYISLVISKKNAINEKKYIPICTDLNQTSKSSLFMLDSQVNWRCLFIEVSIPRKSLQFYANLKTSALLKFILMDVSFLYYYKIQYDAKLRTKCVTGVNWINLSVISI